jgi:hypothetical protein
VRNEQQQSMSSALPFLCARERECVRERKSL